MTLLDVGRLIALAPGAVDVDPLTALLAGRPSWHADAACRGHPDPGLWFPERGEDVRPAQAICAGCPVAGPCLEWALDRGPELQGIWAGTSDRTRRQLRSARRAA